MNRAGRMMRAFGMGVAMIMGAGSALAAGSLPPGASARYHLLGPGENSGRFAVDLRLTVLGEVEHEGLAYVDWQMDVLFEDDKRLAVRAVSERAPMTSDLGCGTFLRYVLRLPNGSAFDYRDERTGLAVLPVSAFRELLLPVPDVEPVLVDGFAGAGLYLGHVLILDRVVRDFAVEPVRDAAVLHLRPDLLVGTGRSFKDDGKGRRPEPTDNYTFVPFDEQDYTEMIAAGTNYFGVTPNQLRWVRDRPVFYRGPAAFPEDYYRSNHIPGPMFSDEPMVRLGWQEATPDEMYHPQQMASFLMSRVSHIYSTNMSVLTPVLQHLATKQIYPPVMPEHYILAPTWETIYEAAFYELAGGAPGIVHEGRYVEEGYGWEPTRLFGPGLEVTTREMLLCYYAFLRGAARAFDGDWGTSIYGQSDPAMRVEALTLAYDMGAKYLWFWTSDHDHHMEYPEQLALAKAIRDHAAAHPRPALEELRDGARVAIVFPSGYTLTWKEMWEVRPFAFENRNRTGTPYREVAAAALWEGVLCAKRGIPFDFTVAHEGLADLGYEELLLVGEDASVTPVPNRLPGRRPPAQIRIEADEPADRETDPAAAMADDDAITAMAVLDRTIRVDGALEDWEGAAWVTHRDRPSGDGDWDGPRDLATRIAFAWDTTHLYVAAVVEDDRHHQPFYGWNLWKGDSIQIGFDPLNERNVQEYSGNQHEIGFALLEDRRSIAWRWHGRRGQWPHEMAAVDVVVRRDDGRGQTVYEAAVPWSELAPMAPAITPVVGVGVTFNDADTEPREVFHETSPGAMTEGKHPEMFRRLVLAPPPAEAREGARGPRCWAAIVWDRTVVPVGEAVTFDLMTATWDGAGIVLEAELTALTPRVALPARARYRLVGGREPVQRNMSVFLDAEPGRHRLTITVRDRGGVQLARESMTVFVYPSENGT